MRWIATAFLAWVVLPLQAADLTSTNVERWIGSMPQIQSWLDSHDDAMPAPSPAAPGDLKSVFDQGVSNLRKAGLYQSFYGELKRYGYQSVEQWSDETAQISMAYLAIEMEREPITLSQLQAQLAQVEAAEGLPPEQAKAMKGMLKSTIAMMRQVRSVSVSDKQAIKPFLKQVEQVLGR